MTAALDYWPLLLLPALWVAAVLVHRRNTDTAQQQRRTVMRRLAWRRNHGGQQ